MQWPQQHNFPSMELSLWGRAWKFILVNPLLFVLNIVIKDLFFITCNEWYYSEAANFCLERWLVAMDMQSFLFFSLISPACWLFLFFPSSSRWWIGLRWGQLLIPKYLYEDWIWLIFLKFFDQSLMSIMVWAIYQWQISSKKTLKTNFTLATLSNDTLAINTAYFLAVSVAFFSNLKLPQ